MLKDIGPMSPEIRLIKLSLEIPFFICARQVFYVLFRC